MQKLVSGLLVFVVTALAAAAPASSAAPVGENPLELIRLARLDTAASSSAVLALQDHDFRPSYASWTLYDFNLAPSKESSYTQSIWRSMKNSIGSEIPRRKLSQRELEALAVWRVPGCKIAKTWKSVLDDAKLFYDEQGRLPANGAELVFFRNSRGDLDDLEANDRGTACRLSFCSINKITGKLYSSFESAAWSPGELNIEVLSTPEAVEQRFPRTRIDAFRTPAIDPQRPREVWIVTMYGEAHGSVLYQGEFFYE